MSLSERHAGPVMRIGFLLGVLVLAAACAATERSELGDGENVPAEPPAMGAGGAGGGPSPFTPSGGGEPAIPGGPPCDHADPTGDLDGDGFSVDDGDCNDCSPQMNPGAYDYADNLVDEDCNGALDDEPTACDTTITAMDAPDARDGARAMGLCRDQSGDSWGLLNARYTLADGTTGIDARSHGLKETFGDVIVPREGTRMLILSSGYARAPGDPGFENPDLQTSWLGTTSAMPTGFPVPSPSCSTPISELPDAYDPAALQIDIVVPTNAESFSFDFDFYTEEFPVFICKHFNDFFVALQQPAPTDSMLGNIAFDTIGNPISVNNSFLEVCESQTAGGKFFACPQGPGDLAGTGFEGNSQEPSHAATGWLVTTSPVTPGETITLRFAVWDSGDYVLPSTVMLDNFRFNPEPADSPITEQVPR